MKHVTERDMKADTIEYESSHRTRYAGLAKSCGLQLLIAALGIMDRHTFGNAEDAALRVEANPVCGTGREFDFAGLGPSPRDHGSDRASTTKLCNQQLPVGGVIPDPKLVLWDISLGIGVLMSRLLRAFEECAIYKRHKADCDHKDDKNYKATNGMKRSVWTCEADKRNNQ